MITRGLLGEEIVSGACFDIGLKRRRLAQVKRTVVLKGNSLLILNLAFQEMSPVTEIDSSDIFRDILIDAYHIAVLSILKKSLISDFANYLIR